MLKGIARIRPYRPGDAEALSELYRRSVEELGPRFYQPDQVAVWASLTPTPERLEALMADGRIRLVAVGDVVGADAGIDAGTDGHPLAFVDLEPDGHIHFLYCAPEAAGRGIVLRLCAALESLARARGIARLSAEASEAAKRFFEKRGFAVTKVCHFQISGVGIHNHSVEKLLETRS